MTPWVGVKELPSYLSHLGLSSVLVLLLFGKFFAARLCVPCISLVTSMPFLHPQMLWTLLQVWGSEKSQMVPNTSCEAKMHNPLHPVLTQENSVNDHSVAGNTPDCRAARFCLSRSRSLSLSLLGKQTCSDACSAPLCLCCHVAHLSLRTCSFTWVTAVDEVLLFRYGEIPGAPTASPKQEPSSTTPPEVNGLGPLPRGNVLNNRKGSQSGS